jgi:hypothetical protein
MRKLRIPALEGVAQTTSSLTWLMGFVRAPFSAADAALGRSRPSSSGNERPAQRCVDLTVAWVKARGLDEKQVVRHKLAPRGSCLSR